MRRCSIAWLFLLVTMSTGHAADVAPSPPTSSNPLTEGITIRLAGPADPVELGQHVKMTATIVNSGDKAVTLVKPGDGSESGWRTPFIGWAVVSDSQRVPYPADVPLSKGLRCGNMNALKQSDIVTVEPGKELVLDEWIGTPHFTAAGSYHVRFYYRNMPEHAWKGGGLDQDDQKAVKAMHASTPCFAISNEVAVVVEAKKE